MTDDRRHIAAVALEALEREIKLRTVELAALERSAETLGRSIRAACSGAHPDSPCAGPISAAWCRGCGEVEQRCQLHGGLRTASMRVRNHTRAKHPGHLDPAPDDTSAVLGGGPPVPVGGLPKPPRS